MAERFKAHAWKACWAQVHAGSNPVLSAMKSSVKTGGFLIANLDKTQETLLDLHACKFLHAAVEQVKERFF